MPEVRSLVSADGPPSFPRWTTEGLLFLPVVFCILGAAYLQHANLLFFLFAWLVAPALAALWLCKRNLRGLQAARRLPDEAFAGQPVKVEIEIAAEAKASPSYCLWIADRIDPGFGQPDPRCALRDIAARASQRCRYTLVPPRRGRFRFGPVTADSSFPLGIFRRQVGFDAIDALIVYPALGTLTSQWHLAWQRATAVSELRQSGLGRNQEHYHALREFRLGDNPRHIHWRTSARLGELMIKEYDAERDRHVLVVVEPWLPAAPTDDQRKTLEFSLSFAATACVAAAREADCDIELSIAGGEAVEIDPVPSTRLDDMLERLALVQGSPDTDLRPILDHAIASGAGYLDIWIISTRSIAGWLHEILGRSAGGLGPQVHVLDASAGDLSPYFSNAPLPVS